MKSIWKSKTLWLAVVQFAIGGTLVVIQGHPELGGLLILKSILDMCLRFLTTEPIV